MNVFIYHKRLPSKFNFFDNFFLLVMRIFPKLFGKFMIIRNIIFKIKNINEFISFSICFCELNIPAKINRHSGMAETARPEYRKPL